AREVAAGVLPGARPGSGPQGPDPGHGRVMGGGPGLLDPQRVTSRARQENFPVASRLLPRAARGHLMAVYGFARLVDDAGDEAPGDQGELLDRIASDL